ncbi:hypothetical protein P9112_000298 [Eukaryota sp. TZLM1-RC]
MVRTSVVEKESLTICAFGEPLPCSGISIDKNIERGVIFRAEPRVWARFVNVNEEDIFVFSEASEDTLSGCSHKPNFRSGFIGESGINSSVFWGNPFVR